jgi:hypothetical protein
MQRYRAVLSACGLGIVMESVLPLPYLLFFFGAVSHPRPASVKPPAPEKAITACRAVVKADVELALGRSVAPAEEEVNGPESTCDYAGGKGIISITLRHSPDKVDLATEIATLKAAIPEGSIHEAKGFESRAYVMEIPGAGAQLHVIREEHDYLLVSVLGFAEPAEAALIAEKIARKALAGM